MTNIVRNIEAPVTVDGSICAYTPFTVTVAETPTKVVATITYEGTLIGEPEFAGGTGIENVITTIRNVLTPEPPYCHL
jgi:hypothetical protein